MCNTDHAYMERECSQMSHPLLLAYIAKEDLTHWEGKEVGGLIVDTAS